MAKSKVSKNEQKPSDKQNSHPTETQPDLNSQNLQPDHSVISKPGTATASTAGHTAEGNGHATITMAASAPANGHITPELAEKIKELVRLAQEQGYLTYNDINESLPDNLSTPEEVEEIIIQLRNLEIEIVDQAEVDRVKQPEPEEEEEKSRLDILDDPVRMYLKQMGQVPLLTREQEVEISKRIEDAENEVKRIIQCFGFSGKEHIALADKLISEPPKERFDRVVVDKKIEGRENHLKALRKLVKTVRELDQQVDEKYAEWQKGSVKDDLDKLESGFKKLDRKLQSTFSKFYFKQKVIEEMALVAENIHDKIQASLHVIQALEADRQSPAHQAVIESEQRKIQALEEFVRLPCQEYL